MVDVPPSASFERHDELRRLAALFSTGLMDGEVSFDLRALVDVAADLLGCSTAFLTLIDRDTLHARVASTGASTGTSTGAEDTIPRDEAPCSLVVADDGPLVINDLSDDPRFADGLLVAQGIRFYAGVPLHARDPVGGVQPIGALCGVDTGPRRLGAAQQRALERLGTVADALIAARAGAKRAVDLAVESDRLASSLAREHRVFAQAERMTGIGAWRLSVADEQVRWTEGVYRIYGLPPGAAPTLELALAPFAPAARARVSSLLARTIETGEPFDFAEDFHPADAPPRRVRCMGEREEADGRPVALVGVFQDVTERHWLEETLRRDAETDVLTGLCNRGCFERRLEKAMDRARRHGSPLMLAMIDLDGFKAINDTLGHTIGDDVLRAIGRTLGSNVPDATLAARLGGDEFAVIVENATLCAAPDELVCRLEEALRVPVGGSGGLFRASGTVGLAAFDPADRTVRDFVHRADVALYAGKRARIGERRSEERRRAA